MILDLVPARRGHFRLESGYHGGLWLDLDSLFADPRRVRPIVTRLAAALRPHGAAAVCGPLLGGAFLAQLLAHELDVEFAFTERIAAPHDAGLFQARYRLPATLGPRLSGKRVALVDDVMSAGSSMRATYSELRAHEAAPVVVGALLVLGSTGADFFTQAGVAVESLARMPYESWPPANCPLCAAGVPLEDPTVSG